MKNLTPLLQPKQSTVNKILLYSKSLNTIKSNLLNNTIVVNMN